MYVFGKTTKREEKKAASVSSYFRPFFSPDVPLLFARTCVAKVEAINQTKKAIKTCFSSMFGVVPQPAGRYLGCCWQLTEIENNKRCFVMISREIIAAIARRIYDYGRIILSRRAEGERATQQWNKFAFKCFALISASHFSCSSSGTVLISICMANERDAKRWKKRNYQNKNVDPFETVTTDSHLIK